MEAIGRFRLQRFDAVDSTNLVIKRALEANEPEGLAVTARCQTGGYGRQGRAWASPEGGMYLSLLLRPSVAAVQLPTLSLAVAVAVRRALASVLSADMACLVKVKWPNDVVFCPVCTDGADIQAFQKIVGISLEQHAGGVCVGIGVNVKMPAEQASVDGKNTPCYLEQLGMLPDDAGAVEAVRVAVLTALDAVYEQWLTEGFEPLRAEYERYSALAGCTVAVENREGGLMAEGVVRGISADGQLLIADRSTGSVRTLSSGEAHLRLPTQ